MRTILFVCTGNVCRSPMAEGLFRNAVKGRGDFRVLSAGVGAIEGQPPSAYAVQALRELGIDISQQRSRMLTADVVNEADYIFGMTHGHVDAVNLLYPHATEKTFLLREFDETLDVFEKDISDPIGGSYEIYRSEERRVGEEGRSRWAPDHLKKKKKNEKNCEARKCYRKHEREQVSVSLIAAEYARRKQIRPAGVVVVDASDLDEEDRLTVVMT